MKSKRSQIQRIPLHFEANLTLLYGTESSQQAHKLLNGEEQYFGLGTLGANMEDSVMHQCLLEAYAKVWR